MCLTRDKEVYRICEFLNPDTKGDTMKTVVMLWNEAAPDLKKTYLNAAGVTTPTSVHSSWVELPPSIKEKLRLVIPKMQIKEEET